MTLDRRPMTFDPRPLPKLVMHRMPIFRITNILWSTVVMNTLIVFLAEIVDKLRQCIN